MTRQTKSKKAAGASAVPKMNARDTERVLKELQAFEDGLRPTCTLTWKHLAKVVHFTDRTLRSKPKIRARFEQVQNALLGKGRIRRSTGMVHDDLQRANDRLRGEVRRYKKLEDSWLERWARIAASLMAHGMSIDQFDVDLPLKNERRKD